MHLFNPFYCHINKLVIRFYFENSDTLKKLFNLYSNG